MRAEAEIAMMYRDRGRSPAARTVPSLAKPGSRSYAIDMALLARFPSAEIPFGEQTKLAAEFGVTRQLVQQRAALLGMVRMP